jgi:hypothetical protein
MQVPLESLAQLRPTMFLCTVSFVVAGSIHLRMDLEGRWRTEAHHWEYCPPGGTKHAFVFGGVQHMVAEMVVVSFGAQLAGWTRRS